LIELFVVYRIIIKLLVVVWLIC